MYKIYDFRCTNGHVTEEFVKDNVTESRCKTCGEPSTRMVSAPSFHLDGSTGHFPGQHMKWVREHEKAGRKKSPQ
jgi:putative FmdB family regulatory protein